MSRGSYLCGDIQFEMDEILLLTHCHCTNCRKLSGAAFGTSAAHVIPEQFRSITGTELRAQHESAPGSFRTFGRMCSSSVPGQADYLPTISSPAELFDDDPGASCSSYVSGFSGTLVGDVSGVRQTFHKRPYRSF